MHSYIVNRRDIPFPILVWGEDWSYRIPISTVYAVPELDTTFPSYLQSSVGYMYDLYGYSAGKFIYGNPPDGSPLVDVVAHFSGYKEVIESNWWEQVIGVDFYQTTSVRFRVYYGECNTLPSTFTKSDILALTNGTASTGPRTLLCTSSRNLKLDFPETPTSKYRVIAIPTSFVESNPIGFNRIRYVDNTSPTWVESVPWWIPAAELKGYDGDPWSGPILGSDSSNVQYTVYVTNPISSSFDLYARYLISDYQQNVIIGPRTGSSWYHTGSINKVPNLISMRILSYLIFNGAIWAENFTAASCSFLATASATASLNFANVLTLPKSAQSSASITLTGFDGVFDYRGSSGYRQVDFTVGDFSDTTYSASSLLTAYSGSSGTASIMLNFEYNFFATGSPSMSAIMAGPPYETVAALTYLTYYAN